MKILKCRNTHGTKGMHEADMRKIDKYAQCLNALKQSPTTNEKAASENAPVDKVLQIISL